MPKKIKLVFLGTGDLAPSKERNHSSTYLEYDGQGMLFDCGEGTQRQFKKAEISIMKLRKIFISHWHGDHVLGIPGVLQSLAFNGYKNKLEIYGPRGTKSHIDLILKAFAFQNTINFEVKEMFSGKVDEKDFYVSVFPLYHGIQCNGYSFSEKDAVRIDKKKMKNLGIKQGKHLKDLKEGKSFEYNGKKYKAKDLIYKERGRKVSVVYDTSYNQSIIKEVKDSDLLVIEATFSDELKEMAKERKHLTSTQAGEIAKKGKVKKLVLTHISQRYEKNTDVIKKEAEKKFKNVIVAKDLMSLEI